MACWLPACDVCRANCIIKLLVLCNSKSGNYNIDPTLSFGATLFTALHFGLALLFGRKRAREFIDLEIEEGVKKNTTAKPEPKYWLHWTCFVLGFISVLHGWK